MIPLTALYLYIYLSTYINIYPSILSIYRGCDMIPLTALYLYIYVST